MNNVVCCDECGEPMVLDDTISTSLVAEYFCPACGSTKSKEESKVTMYDLPSMRKKSSNEKPITQEELEQMFDAHTKHVGERMTIMKDFAYMVKLG